MYSQLSFTESYQKDELIPAADPLSPTLIPAYLNAGKSVFKLINSRPIRVEEVMKSIDDVPNTFRFPAIDRLPEINASLATLNPPSV